MDFSKLIDLKFWFDMNPSVWQNAGRTVLIVVAILIVLGIIAKIRAVSGKCDVVFSRLAQQFGSILIFFGGFGLFFWLARQQRVPIFSARFWWLTLVIIVIIWFVSVLIKAKKYKENKQKQAERVDVYDKYLP